MVWGFELLFLEGKREPPPFRHQTTTPNGLQTTKARGKLWLAVLWGLEREPNGTWESWSDWETIGIRIPTLECRPRILRNPRGSLGEMWGKETTFGGAPTPTPLSVNYVDKPEGVPGFSGGNHHFWRRTPPFFFFKGSTFGTRVKPRARVSGVACCSWRSASPFLWAGRCRIRVRQTAVGRPGRCPVKIPLAFGVFSFSQCFKLLFWGGVGEGWNRFRWGLPLVK